MRGILRECGLYLASAGLYLASARGYIFDFILGPPFLIFRKHSFSVPRTFVVGEYLGSSNFRKDICSEFFARVRKYGCIFDFIPRPPFLIFRKHSFSVPRTRFARDLILIAENPAFQFIAKYSHVHARICVASLRAPGTCLLFRLLGGYLCSSNFPKRHLFLSFRASAGLYFRFHAGTSVSHFRKQGFSVPRTFWENICVLQIFRKDICS